MSFYKLLLTAYLAAQLPESEAVTSAAYFLWSDSVACTGASRYCVNNKFNNEYVDYDMEFMEGDTPQSMTALWWKERCSQQFDTECAPEKTCAGTSGTPITTATATIDYTGVYQQGGTTSYTLKFQNGYTFDQAGCYYLSDTSQTGGKAPATFYRLQASTNDNANSVYAQIRIRRLWQFPSISDANPLPSDVYNRELQAIYESPDSYITDNHGWMLGDVVPLNSCAYVVS